MCAKKDTSYPDAKLWLENVKKPWLLIVDNADDPALDLSQFIPSGNRGSILITTRNKECDVYGTCSCYHFERLEFEDAVELLLKAAGCGKRAEYVKQAQVLVGKDVLAHHALAIMQAGAFIRQGLCQIQDYHMEFKHQRKILLEHRPAQARSIYGDVYATFEVSATALRSSSERECAEALKLLEVLAFYHREKIPEELFIKAWAYSIKVMALKEDSSISHASRWHVENLNKVLHARALTNQLDLIRLQKARQALLSFSLINFNQETKEISMHPLVHAWAKDRLETSAQTNAWAVSLSILHLAIDTYVHPDSFKVHPHMQTCIRLHPDDLALVSPSYVFEICRTLCKFTSVFTFPSQFDLVEELAKLLMSRICQEKHPPPSDSRNIFYIISLCQYNSGKLNESLQSIEYVVELDKDQKTPQEDRNLALQQLAAVRIAKDRTQNAMEALTKIFKILQMLFVAYCRNDLSLGFVLRLAYSVFQQEKIIQILGKIIQILGDLDLLGNLILPVDGRDLLASLQRCLRACLDVLQPGKAIQIPQNVRKKISPVAHFSYWNAAAVVMVCVCSWLYFDYICGTEGSVSVQNHVYLC